MKRILYVTLALAVGFSAWALASCTKSETVVPSKPSTTVESQTPSAPSQARTRVLVYFTRGEYLGVGAREVEAAGGEQALAEAAMRELLKGPNAAEKEFGLGTVVPAGTTLRGVGIANGMATVDMSRTYESGGGSLSMLLRVAQVVYTLTQFDGVDRVAFQLDGTPVEAIGGEGIIVSPPVTRAGFEGQAPAILVESPAPGESVTSPVKVSGSANVFEAQLTVEVTDPDGVIAATRSIAASSGTGTRGSFSAEIPFTVGRTGLGEVVFSSASPKDGKRINIIEIPVQMTK